MPKKTLPLTDIEAKNAKPGSKPFKLADGGGLYLEVLPTGGKSWRLKYRFGGIEKRIIFGLWPDVPLKRARQLREEARGLLAEGIDPGEKRKLDRAKTLAEIDNTFEKVAREWFEVNKSSWLPKTQQTTIRRLELNIFPALGNRPIAGILPNELLKVLLAVAKRGAPDTALRLRSLCGQVFRFARAEGKCPHNIALDLAGALPTHRVKHFASVRDPRAVGQLLRDIDEYSGYPIVRAALRMAPYVFLRPKELRFAEWCEFDIEAATWRIPAPRMKMKVEHIVPLAPQVLALLTGLRQITGDGRFLFPSIRSKTTPISDMTLLAALRRLGYGKDQMSVHGFRSMASTLLNESGFDKDWIELQLAHAERDQVRGSYNFASELAARRQMMIEWAEYLDSLREAPAVPPPVK